VARFFIVRISLILVTLLFVSATIFAMTEVLSGDAATAALGQGKTDENVEALRKKLGLDDPPHVRYLNWLGGVVQGDFGESLRDGQPVGNLVRARLANSLLLAAFAFVVGVPTAVAVGILTAVKKDSLIDRLFSVVSLVAISLPEFVTGVVLIIIFSTTLGLLPSSSLIQPGTSPLSRPEILILPAATLIGVLFAYIMRMTRANLIEELDTDYVRTATLKGLSYQRVVFRHAVPNAMLPTISVITINIGWMLGGLIIVESVFAYPGLGRLLLTSIETRDTPLLQALALVLAAAYAISNLIADLSYAALNPRVRLN
jgi:peptide/nickel transport system permease protein